MKMAFGLRDYLAGDTIRSSGRGAGAPPTPDGRRIEARRPLRRRGRRSAIIDARRPPAELARLPHTTTSRPAIWTRLQRRIAPALRGHGAVYRPTSGCSTRCGPRRASSAVPGAARRGRSCGSVEGHPPVRREAVRARPRRRSGLRRAPSGRRGHASGPVLAAHGGHGHGGRADRGPGGRHSLLSPGDTSHRGPVRLLLGWPSKARETISAIRRSTRSTPCARSWATSRFEVRRTEGPDGAAG